jgi:hypothetical protein
MARAAFGCHVREAKDCVLANGNRTLNKEERCWLKYQIFHVDLVQKPQRFAGAK